MKNFTLEDHHFMTLALEEAKKAMLENEVPVGSLIIDQNKSIIAATYNKVETHRDATYHAEILAIKKASQIIEDWRLVDLTLYVTLEPCIMCAGAAILSRIKRIIWGCPDYRHGAAGSLLDVFKVDHPIHKVEIEGGLLAEESKSLLQTFFQERRRSACSK